LPVAAQSGSWPLARIYELFSALASRRTNRGNHLQGGGQQMPAIGRALTGNPALPLMEEPLEGLAPVIVDRLPAGFARDLRDAPERLESLMGVTARGPH
jgi:branched-chain amino acid transport system ATP-binding protein